MMTLMPERSRRDLYFRLTEKKDSHFLLISDSHAALVARLYPELMAKSNTGFRQAKQEQLRFAYFKGLSRDDLVTLKRFRKAWDEYVLLGRTDGTSSDALYFCMALGMRAQKPIGPRSRIGKLVHEAKYNRNREAIMKLAQEMHDALYWVSRICLAEQPVVTTVPAAADKQFDLPSLLLGYVRERYDQAQSRSGLLETVNMTLPTKHFQMKNLSMAQRIQYWQKVIANGEVKVDGTVVDRCIVIIDDIFQSGTTLWSCAGLLKQLGARRVAGLVCEKTLRNTDNQ